MKKTRIRTALTKYHHPSSDTILLEVLEGKPRSTEGGLWLEANADDIEKLTEDPAFDPATSGWKKYLDKWYGEGLITTKERDEGKT